ncbi:hypothetical protein A2U01_0083191, partial [Trifolium medium]|nr:hypothetical protein [Trifolium medium]
MAPKHRVRSVSSHKDFVEYSDLVPRGRWHFDDDRRRP